MGAACPVIGGMVLTALVECPECGEDVEGIWEDDSMDEEQRDEAPVATQECPAGHSFEAQYPGWSWLTEAG
jgi:hypothetical protein